MNIWPGIAPGSAHWSWKENVFHGALLTYRSPAIGTVIDDVVTPTLTAYLPKRSQATGTGVVIAPGGGCVLLVMKPADKLARMLQGRGVAAFVLKYRLQHEPGAEMPRRLPRYLNEDIACQWSVADAVQALRVVRERGKAWDVSPHRVGIIGFSAGGYIASEALVQENAALRPDFAGLIYGAPFASMPAIPANLPPGFKLASPALPPVFMAWAQDDAIAGHAMARFYRLLKAEGYRPEAHIYYSGGHGFAANVQHGGTSSHWAQECYWWLQAQGFAPRR